MTTRSRTVSPGVSRPESTRTEDSPARAGLLGLLEARSPASALGSLQEALADPAVEPLDPASLDLPEELIPSIEKAGRILLIGHSVPPPDGDSVGSTLAVARALKALGKQADVCLDEDLPGFLQRLDAGSEIRRAASLAGRSWDLAVLFDVARASRIGDAKNLLPHAAEIAVVDHHELPRPLTPEQFDLPGETPLHAWIVPHCDAACLQASVIIAHLERPGRRFDAQTWASLALPLMVGLLTDTRFFTNPGTEAISVRLFKHLLGHSGMQLTSLEKALELRVPEPAKALLGSDPTAPGFCFEVAGEPKVAIAGFDDAAMQRALAAGRQVDPAFNKSDVIDFFKKSHAFWMHDRYPVSVMVVETRPGVVDAETRSQAEGPAYELASWLGGGGHLARAGANLHGTTVAEVMARIGRWARERSDPTPGAS